MPHYKHWEELLTQRNYFHFQTHRSHVQRKCYTGFLRTLQEYIDKKLPDLFQLIRNIENLMGIYDKDLLVFDTLIASTISKNRMVHRTSRKCDQPAYQDYFGLVLQRLSR